MAVKCIAEVKEYNKQMYERTNMEPDFKEGDQVLVSTLNFNNLKGPNEIRGSFVGPFTILKLIAKNAIGKDRLPFRNKTQTPQDILEVEDSPDPVKKIRLNGKDQRQYLVRFKNQIADKDQCLAEDAIPYGNLHLRSFRTSRRA
ncbi:hypothetical protein O181_043761 [Austropuccinia psidii MF-1]|uniref:Uncharacterized protein n=1 Tax=Austropuccinia psidii MF-1 TaxID=1389203 RepID=A0A9Q3DH95_9BASI|nr:hypothetical protein [Austropuccinia psidii MF-1]